MKKKTTLTSTTTVNQIQDKKCLSNQGIIFKDHDALQTIYKESGHLADSCEFQVHYWALVFRHKAEDSSILDIAIPLVYFNYKQTVSGGRIDFDMAEVSEISTKLAPIAQQEAQKVLSSSFQADIQSLFNIDFTPTLVPLNTIHKHPGSSRSQAFSGTDLDKNPKDHGVVYPVASAKDNVPNFAGIMALDGSVNNTAHFEYRLVNGELNKDITYTEGRCLAITVNSNRQSTIEQLMGYEKAPEFTTKTKNSNDNIAEALHSIYKETDYRPFTLAIRPENVTKAAAKAYTNQYAKYIPTTASLFEEEDDEELPTFHSEVKLKTMTDKELAKYLQELEAFAYGVSYQSPTSRSDIMDAILDIQLDITLTKPPSRSEMITSLAAKGFSKSNLILKTTENLEYLYTFEGK